MYKKKYKPKKKRTERQKAEDELWRVFSLWIRQRDADDNGYMKCISCGKVIHWRDGGNCHAGHYYSRGIRSVKYHEKNSNGQCYSCNMHQEGNKQGYAVGLIKKYGEGVLDELMICKNNTSKLGTQEMKILTNDYLRRLKENGYATV